LRAGHVTLRELQHSDAPALWAFLSADDVTQFLSPPPPTVEGFERFIAWARRERADGIQASLAVLIEGFEGAVGLFQLRKLEPDFSAAEWGFAIGSAFWGTGVFRTAAELMMQFAFDIIGVHRLEARISSQNTRGSAALRKIGAVRQGVVRRTLFRGGGFQDEVRLTVLEENWRRAKVIWGGEIRLN
jgi:RimJ/RimL family protein N-acetyltransferase